MIIFTEFYASMLTGINFSPPLYFLFNFCLQLILPTSDGATKNTKPRFLSSLESSLFFLNRNIFGTVAAF